MDEKLLQEWSEALEELRARRAKELETGQEQKTDFSPADFFEIATASLDAVLERWYAFEKRGPSAPDAVRGELENVFEFELEALQRDLAAVRGASHWDEGQLAAAQSSFQSSADLLKQKYFLKIAGNQPAAAATAKAARAAAPKPAAPAPAKYGGGSGGGSGGAMFLMFLLGLALGGGPSYYFWNLSKQQGQRTEEQKAKLAADKRALEDSMALLRGRFDQLASGELKSLPEIERTEDRIRREADQKKQAVEADYQAEKARILKRVPAGERQDALMAANDEKRNSAISEIEAATAQAIDPFEKQKAALQELRTK